jgi:hypothetical protein
MGTDISQPLKCSECKGVLLAERAVRLENGGDVLRYVCQDCHSRSYAVSIGSVVRVYPSRAIEYGSSTSELSYSLPS